MAQQERVVRSLRAAGVAALPLKGPTLAELLHGDVGLRVSSDVDLLVAPANLPPAVAALRNQGYAAPADRVGASGLPDLHFSLLHPERPTVELHWRVHWHEAAFSRDLLLRATGRDGHVPESVDLGAALLLYFARDGFYGLRIAADLAAWWDRFGADLGGGLLDAHIVSYPQLERTWRAAAQVAQRFVGVPARTWLSDPRCASRRALLAGRLANWSQDGDRDQLAANITLVDALLDPRAPAGDLVRRELARAPDGRPLLHAVKLGARVLRALWRVRRESWSPIPQCAEAG